MKNFTVFLLAAICFICSENTFSQTYKDVIHLKNGSIIKGIVIEQIPDSTIKIQTSDGSIFVYQMKEISKINKEIKNSPSAQTFDNQNSMQVNGMAEEPSNYKRFNLLIFGGVAVPSGDLSDADANTGFCFGSEGIYMMNPSFGLMYDVSYSFNGMQEPYNGSFSTTWILVGGRAETRFSPESSTKVYGQGLIGFTNCSFPSASFSYYGYNVSVNSQSYSGFGFGLGAGLIFNDKFNLGMRYFHAAPEDFSAPVIEFIFGIQL